MGLRTWITPNYQITCSQPDIGSSCSNVAKFYIGSYVPKFFAYALQFQSQRLDFNPSALFIYRHAELTAHLNNLAIDYNKGTRRCDYTKKTNNAQSYIWGIFRTKETLEIALRFSLGPIALYGGAVIFYFAGRRSGWQRWLFGGVGGVLIGSGMGAFFLPIYWQDDCEEYGDCQGSPHQIKSSRRQICEAELGRLFLETKPCSLPGC